MSEAPHPRPPRLPWRRVLAAAVVAIGLGGAIALPAPSATATGIDPSPETISEPVEGELNAEIVLQDSGVITQGQPVAATLILSNRTDTIASAGQVAILIDQETIDTRYELNLWNGGAATDEDASGTEVFRQNVDQVHPGSTVEIPVTLPATATSLLNGASFGARGITAQWLTGDLVAEGRSSFVWNAESLANPVIVNPIVPIVSDVGQGALLTASELTTLTAEDGDLTLLLDAVEGTSATLAIDPRLLASVRALGGDAPPSAVAWLDRLEALENASFPLEYADASLTLQQQAGLEQPIRPTGFSYATADHEFFEEVAPTASPTASTGPTDSAAPDASAPTETDSHAAPLESAAPEEAQPETGAPATTSPSSTDPAQTEPSQTDPAQTETEPTEAPQLEARPAPTLDELLAFDYSRPDVTWPAAGTVSDPAGLAEWGAGTIILDGTQATLAPDRSSTLSSQQQVDGIEVLVTDSTLDDAIESAVTAESELLYQDATTDVATLLSVIARELPNESREIVTTLPREALQDPVRLGTLLDQMGGNQWTDVAPIPQRADDPSILPETELIEGAYPSPSVARFQELLAARERGMSLTALYDDPVGVAEELDAELLGAISNSVVQTEAWPNVAQDFTEFATAAAEQITIVPGSEIQLIGHESSLPLFIQNDSDRDVTVEVRLRPTTGHILVDEVTVVRIPAGGVTRATLPVQAIANGVSGVEATLWTTTDIQLNNTEEFVVNVNASLETVAVGVLIGAGVLLFVVGIWRTVRRRKRERTAEVGESTETTTDREPESPGEPRESSTHE